MLVTSGNFSDNRKINKVIRFWFFLFNLWLNLKERPNIITQSRIFTIDITAFLSSRQECFIGVPNQTIG